MTLDELKALRDSLAAAKSHPSDLPFPREEWFWLAEAICDAFPDLIECAEFVGRMAASADRETWDQAGIREIRNESRSIAAKMEKA